MPKKVDDFEAKFEGVNMVELVKKVLTGRANERDHELFASFCGRGLRNWQDLKILFMKKHLGDL